MSREFDLLRDTVAPLRTVTAGVITLLNDISKRLHDAAQADDPAAMTALAADIAANTKALADAVIANTVPDVGSAPAP